MGVSDHASRGLWSWSAAILRWPRTRYPATIYGACDPAGSNIPEGTGSDYHNGTLPFGKRLCGNAADFHSDSGSPGILPRGPAAHQPCSPASRRTLVKRQLIGRSCSLYLCCVLSNRRVPLATNQAPVLLDMQPFNH